MVNAAAALNALSPSLTFGDQEVGTVSGGQAVTLSAIGPLDVNDIVVTGDFSESTDCATGPMYGQCVMVIVFQPTATGTVTIRDNGYFSTSLVIDLTGYGSGVVVSPSSLSFAPQAVGTTSPAKTVTLTNKTPKGLMMGQVQRTGAFVVSSNTCTGSIASGASCAVGVEFAPMQAGTATAFLAIYDRETATGGRPWTPSAATAP